MENYKVWIVSVNDAKLNWDMKIYTAEGKNQKAQFYQFCKMIWALEEVAPNAMTE